MTAKSWDMIIVGQGLAGTTLAWRLQDAGCRVLVLDAAEPATSSTIAGGLMTPITGQRLVMDARYDAFLEQAAEFYRTIEKRTARHFFHERTAVRLFASEEERQKWSGRKDNPGYRRHLLNPQPEPLIDPDICTADAGGFAMHAAQLDVPAYLTASRNALATRRSNVNWQSDLKIGPGGVRLGGEKTGLVISCEGYRAGSNPYFAKIRFKPAKGDILTVRFRRPLPAVNLHRGIWLAQTRETDVFRAGATYDRERSDPVPDPAARRWLEKRLRAFIRIPYDVLDHAAGVRPVLEADRVLAGLHPNNAQLGYFNGLGSKGALLAPWHARCLADHLADGAPLPDDTDLRRYLSA